jgi:hypothetical protein
MNSFKYENQLIEINFETQISKLGRPFRLSGIALVTQKPALWVDKMYRHNTIYTFRYLDTYDEFFSFEFDANDKLIGKV